MTVKELITELLKCNQSAEIYYRNPYTAILHEGKELPVKLIREDGEFVILGEYR